MVATLEEYLKRTKVWRGKDKNQLLLNFVKPHNPVVSLIISGSITNVLREAGIDTKMLKGHSTRSASTSKAVIDILERDSSSNALTRQRLHKRQVPENTRIKF